MVDYDAQFAFDSEPGMYDLSSALLGPDNSEQDFLHNGAIIVVPSLFDAGIASGQGTDAPKGNVLGDAAFTDGNDGNNASTTSIGGSIFGTPRANAASGNNLLAALGNLPQEGLLFWAAIVFALLIVMGGAVAISHRIRPR